MQKCPVFVQIIIDLIDQGSGKRESHFFRWSQHFMIEAAETNY